MNWIDTYKAKLEDNGFELDPLQITPYIPKPTEKQYIRGYIFRYFVQNMINRSITEVDKEQYDMLQNKIHVERSKFILGKLKWRIKGTLEPSYDSKTQKTVIGVEKYNSNQINELNKIIPGIQKKLRNTVQFFL